MTFAMLRELCFLFESFSAIAALERLVSGVNSQVILQVATLVEFASANATDKKRVESLSHMINDLPLDALNPIYDYFNI